MRRTRAIFSKTPPVYLPPGSAPGSAPGMDIHFLTFGKGRQATGDFMNREDVIQICAFILFITLIPRWLHFGALWPTSGALERRCQ